METNLLIAINNIVKNPTVDILSKYKSSIRINAIGDALEFYVKDLFCNSLAVKSAKEKSKVYSKYFSYLGNQNNPPDIMIKGGDAIEVKKIENPRSGIALNSSYPKNKLSCDDPMITSACKVSENWQKKDLIYTVGVCKDNILKSLWFVYGDCYAADKEIYERVSDKISKGVSEIKEVEFSKTKEIGRVNKVDPLGITYLRIRGMWGIENPIKVFEYILPAEKPTEFSVNVIMRTDKYLSFPEQDRRTLEKIVSKSFSISDIKIKSPDNPAKLLDAKLIIYSK